MMMTKEEIILAFDAIWFEANNSANLAGEDLQKEHDLIIKFINEHFELVREFEKNKRLDDLLKATERFYTNETYFSHIIKAIARCKDKEIQEYAIHCLFYLKQKLDSLENPSAYKFEELKEGMLVWDESPEYEEFRVFKITKIFTEADCQYFYHDKNKKVFFDDMVCHAREFEENRFFPLTKANQ